MCSSSWAQRKHCTNDVRVVLCAPLKLLLGTFCAMLQLVEPPSTSEAKGVLVSEATFSSSKEGTMATNRFPRGIFADFILHILFHWLTTLGRAVTSLKSVEWNPCMRCKQLRAYERYNSWYLKARIPPAVSGNEPALTPLFSGRHAAGPERAAEIEPMTFVAL